MSHKLASEDHQAIMTLRERLWSGRASVMVGAGFSMNAEMQGKEQFPSWLKLAEMLYEEIHARVPKKNERLDPIGLAAQYAAHFNDTGILSFLDKTVGKADRNSEPGELHRMLLSLPWTDVFTTNFDTLLERTLPSLDTRRYQTIRSQGKIPQSKRPRIIKLHGELEPTTPPIFTQESFRGYPRTHAAFINTVQQSIMENALCLIGFSGADPNFLSWIGWVRDNLGTYAPTVYLCGLLDCSNIQREYYNLLHVHPLDLSPLFPSSEFHSRGARYQAALSWFLKSLNLLPADESDWPNLSSAPRPKLTGSLWEGQPGGSLPPLCDEQLSSSEHRASSIETARALVSRYPGWIVLPYTKRVEQWSLLQDIHKGIDSQLSLDDLSPLLRLHTITQSPLVEYTDLASRGVLLVEERCDRGPLGSSTEETLTLALDLTVTLLEQSRYPDADRMLSLAENLAPLKTDLASEATYLRCQYLLETMQLTEAQKSLESWKPRDSDWKNKLRLSSMRYEVALIDVDAHAKTCSETLSQIRKATSEENLVTLSRSLISLLALEGMTEHLLWQAQPFSSVDDLLKPSAERPLRSKDAMADLDGQLQKYIATIQPDLESKTELRVREGFDSSSYVLRHSNPSPGETSIPAMCRVLQCCGTPFHGEIRKFVAARIADNLGSLGEIAPMRTLSILARARMKEGAAEQHWDHWSMLRMDKEKHLFAFNACLQCIDSMASLVESGALELSNIQTSFSKVSLSFIGMSSGRCEDGSIVDRAFSSVLRFYDIVARNIGVFGPMEVAAKCLRRIARHLELSAVHIQRLAGVAMWGHDGVIGPSGVVGQPELFGLLAPPRQPVLDISIPKKIVARILAGLTHSVGSARYAAMIRYVFLKSCGAFSSEEIAQFEEEIWSTASPGGVPQYPFVLPLFFVRFAHGGARSDTIRRVHVFNLKSAPSHVLGENSGLPPELVEEMGGHPQLDANAISNYSRLVRSTTTHLSSQFPESIPEGWSYDDIREVCRVITRRLASLAHDAMRGENSTFERFHETARAYFDLLFVVAWPVFCPETEHADASLLTEMLDVLGAMGLNVAHDPAAPRLGVVDLLLSRDPIRIDLGHTILRQWVRWSCPSSWGVAADDLDVAFYQFSQMEPVTCMIASRTVICALRYRVPVSGRRSYLFSAGLVSLRDIVLRARAGARESNNYYWSSLWFGHSDLAEPASGLCSDSDVLSFFWPTPVDV